MPGKVELPSENRTLNDYLGLAVGKTVESYRMAVEDEIRRWNGFARRCEKKTVKPSTAVNGCLPKLRVSSKQRN